MSCLLFLISWGKMILINQKSSSLQTFIFLEVSMNRYIQSKTFDQIWETCQLNVLWKLLELFSEFYAAVCQFSCVLLRIFAVIHFWISVLEMATSFFSLPYHVQNVLVIFFDILDQKRRKMMETVANDLYHFQNPPKLLIILYFWKFSLASFMHQSFNRGEILWKLISEKWKFGI